MFCPNCGTQNDDSAAACQKCAFNLKGAAAPKFKGTMLMVNAPPLGGLAPRQGTTALGTPKAQGPTATPSPSARPPAAAPVPRPVAALHKGPMKATMIGVAPPSPGGVAPPAPTGPAVPSAPSAGSASSPSRPPASTRTAPPGVQPKPVASAPTAPAFAASPPQAAPQPAHESPVAVVPPRGQGLVNPLGGTMVATPGAMGQGPGYGAQPVAPHAAMPQQASAPAPQAPVYGAPAPFPAMQPQQAPAYGAPTPSPAMAPSPYQPQPAQYQAQAPAPDAGSFGATTPSGFAPGEFAQNMPPQTSGAQQPGGQQAVGGWGAPIPTQQAAPNAPAQYSPYGATGGGVGMPQAGQMMTPVAGYGGMQTGPAPHGPIGKMREPVMVLVLTMVTCGIFGIISLLSMLGELKAFRQKNDINPILFLLPVVSLLEMIKLPAKVLDAKRMAGVPNAQEPNVILYLLIGLYMLPADLNEIWQVASAKQSGYGALPPGGM